MHDHHSDDTVVPTLNPENLKILSPLGRGAKGVVFLVRENEAEDQQWALKVISKGIVDKKGDGNVLGEYKRVSFERQVLSRFNHPLLPRLHGVLRTETLLGYAIDYCPGRDLNFLRKLQSEKMFSVEIIRFYAAEIVLALEYLHHQGIAYRDLKPENIMIQEDGHIMLVDFDLSTRLPTMTFSPKSDQVKASPRRTLRRASLFGCWKKYDVVPDDTSSTDQSSPSSGKSNSFVGTEEYVAPEIVRGLWHGFEVDWWSFGIVLYEMLYGVTPFRGSNRKETFLKILSKEPELVGEATPLRDLIRNLLIKDPAARIGIEKIKAHKFFEGVDWDSVVRVARPPYIPPVTDRDGWGENNKNIADVEVFVQGIFGSKLSDEGKGNCKSTETHDFHVF